MLKEPSIAKAQTKLKRIPTLITESKNIQIIRTAKNSNQTKNITATKEGFQGKQQHTPNKTNVINNKSRKKLVAKLKNEHLMINLEF